MVEIKSKENFHVKSLLVLNMDPRIRKKYLNLFVWGVALYGRKIWAIGRAKRKRIEACVVL